MKQITSCFILLTFLCTAINLHAQIGKLIKDKANLIGDTEKLKNKLIEKSSNKLDEARAELDSTSFSYAISVNDNADFFETDSKKDQLVKWASNVKNRENANEAEIAKSMVDAGELAYSKGAYKSAALLFNRAKLKYEKNGLTKDPNYYKLIADLGLLASTMGRYTKAEEFTLKALKNWIVAYGESHVSYGATLNNLAVLYKETGRYNESELHINEAIKILENSIGKESMPVAISLNNEAMLYQTMGRYLDAEKILIDAIDISKALQSEKSNNHQKFLTNLALLYQETNNYEEAERMFLELIKIKERRFGSNHPDYAHMLSNLAALYLEMENYEKVESLLIKAIDIYKKNFSIEHALYASAISNLGNFYRYQSRWDEAKPLLTQAMNIRKNVLGEKHPDYVQSVEDMAILHWKTNKMEQAEILYLKALNTSLSFINSYFPPMSEAEKTKYWDKLRLRFERFYAFAIDAANLNTEIMKHVFNFNIATKGLLLSSTNKVKERILQSGNKQLIDKYIIWLDQKETLARYYGYSKEELQEEKINLDSLEEATNTTEKELSNESNLFSEGYKLDQLNTTQISKALNNVECAIEMLRLRKYDNTLTDDVMYLALILTANNETPQYVKIDNGNQLETRYYTYYNNAIHKKIHDDYSYEQYVKAILTKVGDKQHIYFSPDGIYSQININTLMDSEENYMIDKFDITIVGNTKEFIAKNTTVNTFKSAFLVGNPNFGGNTVTSLPGTKEEITSIGSILTSKGYTINKYTENQASEINMKSVNNPKLLHVATHGYFLEDAQINKEKVFGISSESARNNPLLRSGLLFSGSGSILEQEDNASLENRDNGILTAYEAMNLSLDNTELVVLSACETGMGDVKAGEGVYGLQRAFLAAGAKTLIMSLWKVDDLATQKLMTTFYSNWLNQNNKKEAFKQAQLSLKKTYPDPYYWGAFILIGN
ncbi:MAG: CHAT domain-containing protein [Cyclobacteriaceae bacterium]|nr:CHAT domain-containing protein [Cyclobacteriaceae bacterium]